MHEVLVNRLGGLSLPRKSVVRLTDRPDMTLDVYRGRKTTMHNAQWGTGIACFPDSRPCGVCGDASRLRPCQQALRTFRAQASHAPPTTGPAVFAETKVICVPANRPFCLFGHGHRMLAQQQALRCLRRRKSFAFQLTGHLVFSGRASHASPTTGPAVLAGTQVVCVPAYRPFGLFGHGHLASQSPVF